jgi:hypothetical protein
LRHITAAPGQRSDTGGPNLEIAEGLKLRRLGCFVGARGWEAIMSSLAGSRKRVAIWIVVKLFLTICGWRDDAPAAISLDQPLTLSATQIAHTLDGSGNIRTYAVEDRNKLRSQMTNKN